MKYVLVLLVCLVAFFISGPLAAQVFPLSAVDSLKEVVGLPSTSDSLKVMTLHEISWVYVNKDNEQARVYADSAYALGHATGFKDGIRRSAHILANLDYMAQDYPGAEAYAKEAKQIAVENRQPANVARHNSVISNVYKETDRKEQAIELNKESLDLALELKDTVIIIPLQYNYSLKLEEQGELEESTRLLVRLLDYPLSFYQATLILNRVCDAYLSRDMGEQGLPYCHQAVAVADFKRNRQGAYRAYHGIGKYFYKKGQLDSARYYLQTILDTRVKKTDYALALVDMANIDMDEGEENSARSKVDEAMSIFDKAERPDLTFSALLLRANLNAKSENFDLAIRDYDTALSVGEDPEDRMKLLNNSMRIRMRAGRTVPEEHFVEYNHTRDSLQTIALNEKATLVIEEFENERLRAKQALANEQARADRLAITQQRYGLGLAGLLVAGLFGAYFYQRRNRRREAQLNLTLKTQNEEIQNKNARITLLNSDINHRTSHYLTSIIKLLREQKYKMEEAGVATGTVVALERQTLVYTKLQGLLKTVDDRTVVELDDYLGKLTEMLQESFQGAGDPLQLQLQVDNVAVDPSVAAPLALILNELLTNTVKYAKRRGGIIHASFRCEQVKEGKLLVHYEDDGADAELDTSDRFSSNSGLELIEGLTHQLEADRENAEGYGYRVRVEL